MMVSRIRAILGKKKKFTKLKNLLGIGGLFIANHITFDNYISDT